MNAESSTTGEPRSVALTTDDGVRLAADLWAPPGATLAAVVCHPHPQYGGDRHNNVVAALWRALPAAGVACVRFDFRGAGGSDGEHGGGAAERLDVRAAIHAAAALVAGVEAGGDAGRVVLCGYSFGADVALTVADDRLVGWFAVAPPLRLFDPGDYVAATDDRPVLVAAAEHDQFAPPPVAVATVAGWRTTTVVEVPMADHFFAGATHVAAEHAVTFARRFLAG